MASPQGQFRCVFAMYLRSHEMGRLSHEHDGCMELYDAMRTTGTVRQFTDDPLPDDVLHRILDNARFAPTGGNRQGVRVIVVRDASSRAALADLSVPGARRYAAQIA